MPSARHPTTTPIVYLSLGSNLGDREAALTTAVIRLEQGGVHTLRLSALYETEPQDVRSQPWFLNQVAECETSWEPERLLEVLLAVEHAGGRDREGATPRGPRAIDIDILLYGDAIIETAELVIPHPRMLDRRFVLEPLLELNGELIHPKTKEPLESYLPGVLDQELRRVVKLAAGSEHTQA